MNDKLASRSARDLVRGARAGDWTAVQVMAAFLAEVDAHEPTVRAWARLDRDQALAAAHAVDARPSPGPLHGLPIGVKDIIDTGDMPTEYGTPIHRGRRPAVDATLVARLRAAGAVVMGKTVTSEHAVYVAGPTTNPHDVTRTPGGSSSGSAAAVAAGMVPLALATQTNGSTIRPASFCGVVGYKPSLGLLPRGGILEQSSLLDQPGVIARDVADAALLVEAIAGEDERDEQTYGCRPAGLLHAATQTGAAPRIAFVRGPYWQRADPAARASLEQFAGSLPVTVEALELPTIFDGASDVLSAMMDAGIAHHYREDFRHSRSLMAEVLVRIIEHGHEISAVTLMDAFAARDAMRRSFSAIAEPYDAILTAAAPGVAPLRPEGTGDPIFATIWTLLGAPALTLPMLQGAGGLPLGVQLVGGLRQDARLLRAAAWVERHRA